MKAILEFQWPQEEEQFETAYLGHAYKELLKEYNTWLKLSEILCINLSQMHLMTEFLCKVLMFDTKRKECILPTDNFYATVQLFRNA